MPGKTGCPVGALGGDAQENPCGNYRSLKLATKSNRYPLPHIQDLTTSLAGTTFFSKIYLKETYHQMPVAPDSIHETFMTTSLGLFEFISMPFGLRSAVQTLQRFIDTVLRGLSFIVAYINDLPIVSSSPMGMNTISVKFSCLQQYGLTTNLEKCQFSIPSLEFLGHQVSSAEISPLPSKVEAITNFPFPSAIHQL